MDTLDEHGSAILRGALTAKECAMLVALYDDDARFRSKVVMSRHGFGRGESKYFAYPLPPLVQKLRTSLYAELAPCANRWNEAMKIDVRYPLDHAAYLARCHDAGQVRPMLTEQRPRMQSCVEVVPLARGDAVVFAVNQRPVTGTRGVYRVAMRHGVSRVRSGHRQTMGIIFHDAAPPTSPEKL